MLLLLNSVSQCLWHLSCVLMVSLMNEQQETLVKAKQKESPLKPARNKEVICCLVSSLIERGKRQLSAPCWRFMFYVDWCMTSLWFTVPSGWWRCWVLLGVKQQSIFYNLIFLDWLICINIYIDTEKKDASFPQGLVLCHLSESYKSTEWTRLEKSFEIMESNLWPNTTLYVSIEMALSTESHRKHFLNEKYRGLPNSCLKGPSVSSPIMGRE